MSLLFLHAQIYKWAIGQKVCVKTDITVDISIVMSV